MQNSLKVEVHFVPIWVQSSSRRPGQILDAFHLSAWTTLLLLIHSSLRLLASLEWLYLKLLTNIALTVTALGFLTSWTLNFV